MNVQNLSKLIVEIIFFILDFRVGIMIISYENCQLNTIFLPKIKHLLRGLILISIPELPTGKKILHICVKCFLIISGKRNTSTFIFLVFRKKITVGCYFSIAFFFFRFFMLLGGVIFQNNAFDESFSFSWAFLLIYPQYIFKMHVALFVNRHMHMRM